MKLFCYLTILSRVSTVAIITLYSLNLSADARNGELFGYSLSKVQPKVVLKHMLFLMKTKKCVTTDIVAKHPTVPAVLGKVELRYTCDMKYLISINSNFVTNNSLAAGSVALRYSQILDALYSRPGEENIFDWFFISRMVSKILNERYWLTLHRFYSVKKNEYTVQIQLRMLSPEEKATQLKVKKDVLNWIKDEIAAGRTKGL